MSGWVDHSTCSSRLSDIPLRTADCDICRRPFESDAELLAGHLAQHLMELHQKPYRCFICEIDFAFFKDYERHAQASEPGHCGYNLGIFGDLHRSVCTGHHPPSRGPSSTAHQLLKIKLWAWEQRQIEAHRLTVMRLQIERLLHVQVARFSLDNSDVHAAQHDSRLSRTSLKSFASVPAWWKAQDKSNVESLRLSFQNLLLSSDTDMTMQDAATTKTQPDYCGNGSHNVPVAALNITETKSLSFDFPRGHKYVDRVVELRGVAPTVLGRRGHRKKAAAVASKYLNIRFGTTRAIQSVA